jgi:hypothetical protein
VLEISCLRQPANEFTRPALRAHAEDTKGILPKADKRRSPLTGRAPSVLQDDPESSVSPPISPMSDLTARLEALLRLYAAACDQGEGGRLAERFRKDLQLLISEYGHQAADAALDEMPDVCRQSPCIDPCDRLQQK